MKRALIAAAFLASLSACDKPTSPLPEPEQPAPDTPDPVEPPTESEETDDETPPPTDTDADAGDTLTDEEGRTFSYRPAGDLMPGSAPDNIIVDEVVYDDQITFPAEDPVFLNSQVYGHGGSQASLNGLSTDQCNSENYDYPWRDNFCEKRGKDQYFCEDGGHTGVDIRPAGCQKETYWAIAPEAGEIYYIGSYSVRLMAEDGTWWQFLHLDMNHLAVSEGQEVTAGQRIGKISNVFFDSNGDSVPTTVHMHVDMKEAYSPTNGDDAFIDRVSPYMTLVAAYERKLRGE